MMLRIFFFFLCRRVAGVEVFVFICCGCPALLCALLFEFVSRLLLLEFSLSLSSLEDWKGSSDVFSL